MDINLLFTYSLTIIFHCLLSILWIRLTITIQSVDTNMIYVHEHIIYLKIKNSRFHKSKFMMLIQQFLKNKTDFFYIYNLFLMRVLTCDHR